MTALGDAREWLAGFLADGPRPASEVAEAAGVAGVSASTLRRAASGLGVRKVKRGQPGEVGAGWWWSLPDVDAFAAEGAQVGAETVGVSGRTADHLRDERTSTFDGALELLGGLVLDTEARWGAAARSWQIEDAKAVLAPDEGDPRLHWLGRPKGASKTTDVAGMSIAWLLTQAPPLAEGYVIASDGDQANRLLNRARGFIARTPGLAGRVRVEASRIVNPGNGSYVEALAADEAGSQDLLTPWVIVDEVANWADSATARGMWMAAFSAVPKWPGCRLVVLSFAGDPGHWSWKVRERARTSDAWRFVELGGPCPWTSPADLEEQRALLLPSQYVRRYENRWVAGEDKLTSREDVAACVVAGRVALDPQPSHSYVLALDVGLKHDRTVAAVAHLEDRADGQVVVLDRMQVWSGSRLRPVRLAEVEAWVEAAAHDYGAAAIFDPWQAQHLAQNLRGRGVRIEEFTFSQASVGRLATTLYRLLRDHLVELPDEEALVDELANVQLREVSPGSYRLDHSASGHDDRAVALAMAAAHLVEQPRSNSAIGAGFEGRVDTSDSHARIHVSTN